MRRGYVLLALLIAIGAWTYHVQAASLTYISDTISSSRPASISNHAIRFTITDDIPVSGKIIVTPEGSYFTIPGALDFTDVDLLDDSVNRVLAATPGSGGGSADGVSVTSGTFGSLTFTLNDTDSIASGSVIEILIGTNATSGATGDEQIVNPSGIDSYRMHFETQTAGSAYINDGYTYIAVVNPVGLGAGVSLTPTPGGGGHSHQPTYTPIPTPCFRIANFVAGPREDPNHCRVNLYDLSILFYNWIEVRNRPDTDLDIDGKVFTTDFSILLYWWTG